MTDKNDRTSSLIAATSNECNLLTVQFLTVLVQLRTFAATTYIPVRESDLRLDEEQVRTALRGARDHRDLARGLREDRAGRGGLGGVVHRQRDCYNMESISSLVSPSRYLCSHPNFHIITDHQKVAGRGGGESFCCFFDVGCCQLK